MSLSSISSFSVVLLLLCNLGFSAYQPVIVSEPASVCKALQKAGVAKQCQEGTPWQFEVVRHEAQQRFYPTNPELFGCYHRSETGALVRCYFEGAITKFASLRDLEDAVVRIEAAHRHPNLDQYADIVAADTTLENYTVYVFSKQRLLVLMPRTEKGVAVEREVERLLGSSD
jgi:hypothetical protein